MSFPEESQQPEATGPSDEAENEREFFPEEPDLPEGFTPYDSSQHMTRARRRRARRMLVPPGASDRAALMDSLARRAVPSFEFFLFALLCGAVLGAAYLLDSPALLLLGVLLAPLLTPWVGLVLGVQIGSWRFFFLSLGSLIVAAALVFGAGALAGLAGRLWLSLPLFHANIHSHLWWPDLAVTALGAALLVIAFVHSEQKPILPSIMLAYGLFLPLNAAGVGFGIGASPIWPDGALVCLVHLTLAILVGGIVLTVMRFKPLKAIGCFLPILIGLISLAALVSLTGLVNIVREQVLATRWMATRTPTALVLPTLTPAAPQPTPTISPTFTVSLTPAPTDTATPTPSYAVIASSEGGGANLRTEPGGGSLITTLLNGTPVQVLPEIQSVGNAVWVHIRLNDNTEGWVLQTTLTAATLTPTPTPSLTLTPTP